MTDEIQVRFEQGDIERAYEVLRAMVMDEWPSHRYSLAEIVNTWGPGAGVTPGQIAAVRRVEGSRSVPPEAGLDAKTIDEEEQ